MEQELASLKTYLDGTNLAPSESTFAGAPCILIVFNTCEIRIIQDGGRLYAHLIKNGVNKCGVGLSLDTPAVDVYAQITEWQTAMNSEYF